MRHDVKVLHSQEDASILGRLATQILDLGLGFEMASTVLSTNDLCIDPSMRLWKHQDPATDEVEKESY